MDFKRPSGMCFTPITTEIPGTQFRSHISLCLSYRRIFFYLCALPFPHSFSVWLLFFGRSKRTSFICIEVFVNCIIMSAITLLFTSPAIQCLFVLSRLYDYDNFYLNWHIDKHSNRLPLLFVNFLSHFLSTQFYRQHY